MTVTDSNGNASTCSATVTVEDLVDPTITCPADITLGTDENCQVLLPDFTQAGNVVLANSSVDYSGTQGRNGWFYGSYFAFDANGFTPLSPGDFGPIWFGSQAFGTPFLDPNGGHPGVDNLTWAVRRWRSNYDGTVTISGDFYDRNTGCGDGAHVRIFQNGSQVYEYLNIPGSSVPYSITLTVQSQDNIDFVIDPKFDAGCDDTHFTATISAPTGMAVADNCTVASVTQSPAPGTALSVGSQTVTLTVTDQSGNSANCTFSVTTADQTPPTALCQDVTVQLDAAGNGSTTANAVNNGSGDACGIASLALDITDFTCANVGSANTVTLTATDVNDNESTCTATVTVEDNIPPTALCQDVTVQLDAAGNGSTSAAAVDNSSNDACGIASLSLDITDFTCANVGSNPVVLTVTDIHGNTSTCSATVTVEDKVDPTAICQDVTVQLDAAGDGSTSPAAVNDGSFDNCGVASLSLDISAFTCAEVGSNPVVLTVTDINGNSSTCQANVIVQDKVAPTAICQDATVQLDASGNGSTTPAAVDNGSNDACGIASLGLDITDFTCANVGSNPVVLTVTDVNGNTSTCSATVTVQDKVAPTAICQDATVQLDSNGNGYLTEGEVDNGSDDACGIQSLVLGQTAFGCANVGSNTVTLTVTDVNLNTSTCSATVTVQDNIAPTALCQAVTVQLDASGNGSTTAAAVNNGSSDACGIQSAVLSLQSFSCANVGANTVTLTVTDINNNSSTCTATVTVQDNINPNALCKNATVNLDNSGNGSITPNDIDNGSNDNCGIGTLSLSQTGFDCSHVGNNPITLTVTDVNGNVSTCTATVKVQDNIAPVAVCQDVTVQLDNTGNGSTTAAAVNNGSSDACGVDGLSLDVSAFTCSNIGPNTVTLTVTDINDNVSTCPATVTVEDNVDPVAVCQDVTIQLDNTGAAGLTAGDINNGSNDACGVQSVSLSQETFDCSEVGPNTVTLTVTDNHLNTSTCTATVTVEDHIDPVIAGCPANIVLATLTTDCSALGSWTPPTASDNCSVQSLTFTLSPNVSVISVPGLVFGVFPGGVTTVTYTATDLSGNSAQCSFTITVNDETPPILTGCPGNVMVNSNPGLCGANAFWNPPTASDNCPGVTATASHSPGDFFQVGATTVTYSATDASDNTTPVPCTFTVTVSDNTNPTITCPASVVQTADPGLCSALVTFAAATATDNCSATVAYSQDPGTVFQVGTTAVTATATDLAGNTASCNFNVTVTDDEPPTALCQDLTVQLDNTGSASVAPASIDNGSSDVCGIQSAVLSQQSFSCADVGTNTVTLTVTDIHGNVSTCSATVTVQDNIAPTAVCQDATVQLDANGAASIQPADIDNGSSDACGIASLSLDVSSFDCNDHIAGPAITELFISEYVEGSGNTKCIEIYNGTGAAVNLSGYQLLFYVNGSSSVSTTINLSGTVANGDVFVVCDDGAAAAFLAQADQLSTVTFYNGDDAVVLAKNSTPIDIFGRIGQDPGTDWNVSGNSTVDHTLVRNPDVFAGNTDNALNFPSLGTEWTQFANNTSSQLGSHTVNSVPGNAVVLTVTDNNGNTSTCTANVTLEENTPPTAICQDVTVQLNAAGTGTTTAAAVNNGSGDACGIQSLVLSKLNFSCADVGVNTVTLTVTDVNDNVSTCTATVTVQDLIAPIANCNNITVQLNAAGTGSTTAAAVNNGSSDACGIQS
ncbi:MAG: HYR domain-containing protein, partial [Lewinella sp.]|nr:HYR domain-containing protein [Lewinella sp.]